MLKTLRKSETQISPIWKQYFKDRSVETRNRLIEHYYVLIGICARSLNKKFKNRVDIEELEDCCTFGLIEAIEEYDETRSKVVIEYLITKIKYVAIANMRNNGPISRKNIALHKKYNNAIAILITETGEHPDDEEIMEYLAITRKELDTLKRKIKNCCHITNFTSFTSDKYHDIPPVVACLSSKKSYIHLDNNIFFQETIQSLNILSKKQKQVIAMLYTNNINGREVAKKLLISPALVSQLHRSALVELKDKIWSVI